MVFIYYYSVLALSPGFRPIFIHSFTLLVCVCVWCICFPTPGRGLPYGSGLGLSRCLGPGECLHSFIQYAYVSYMDAPAHTGPKHSDNFIYAIY